MWSQVSPFERVCLFIQDACQEDCEVQGELVLFSPAIELAGWCAFLPAHGILKFVNANIAQLLRGSAVACT